jgi:hypothetical protein
MTFFLNLYFRNRVTVTINGIEGKESSLTWRVNNSTSIIGTAGNSIIIKITITLTLIMIMISTNVWRSLRFAILISYFKVQYVHKHEIF